MNALSKDARGFVEAIISHLEDQTPGSQAGKTGAAARVRSFLSKVTAQAKEEKMAHVETRVTLSTQEKARIERLLSKLLGRTIEVEYIVNPAVIAGLTIRVADWIVDTSFLRQLSQIQEQLSA